MLSDILRRAEHFAKGGGRGFLFTHKVVRETDYVQKDVRLDGRQLNTKEMLAEAASNVELLLSARVMLDSWIPWGVEKIDRNSTRQIVEHVRNCHSNLSHLSEFHESHKQLSNQSKQLLANINTRGDLEELCERFHHAIAWEQRLEAIRDLASVRKAIAEAIEVGSIDESYRQLLEGIVCPKNPEPHTLLLIISFGAYNRRVPTHEKSKRRLVQSVILLCLVFTAHSIGSDQCHRCHARLSGNIQQVVPQFESSVHCLAGLSCTDCHGGNPAAEDVTLAKNSGRPFLGRPKTTQIVSLCGACHSSHEYMHRYGPSLRTDQADEYMASRHGKLAAKDDPRVPTCVTCHAAHKTMRVGDPLSPVHPLRVADTCAHCHSDSQRMDGSRLPYNQMELYRSSRHAEALYRKGNLAAPTCNDCHGDHDELKPDTYATSHICGRCHTRERALIESNKHATYLTPQDRPNCGRCHENHAPDPPGLSLLHGASHACTSCHRDDVGAETVERLSLRAIELRERIGNARKFLTDAQNAGIDVRYSLGDLDRASALLLSLRTEIHTLDEARVGIPLKEGIDLADAAYREGVRALKTLQLRDRIQSLFVGVLAIVLIIGGVLYRRSILKRRAQEALLLQEQERIVLSRERLARIGQISAGVAHALRNPLHGVFNCVDLLSTRIPADESLQRILALMTDGLKRIQNVTQRLLVLTREAPLNKTMTNIRVLLEDAIHFMDAESQKKGVVLCLETQGEMAVPLDSNQMTEAILNLLDNALDATSVGGSIIVRAEHQSGNKERLQISIEDNGTGITERDLGEVFNAFFTTKPIGEGTGLGLAITKRIIEDHGGTISIRSLPEKGTCVSIDLPIE